MPSNKKTAIRIEAEKLCKQFPKAPTRTLAKRLAAEFKSTIEQARNLVRYIRGNKGNERRKYAKSRRSNGKSGWKPTPPPVSLAEPWLPFVLDGVKRVGIISDVHIPYHDSVAFQIAIKDLNRRKIDCLLINGDFADFYAISSHERNPKKRDLSIEGKLVLQGLEYIRTQFPKVRIIYKEGNHENRWRKYLWEFAVEISNMETTTIPHWLNFERLGIEWVAEQRMVLFDGFGIFHGHEFGKSSGGKNIAQKLYEKTKQPSLIGHHHRIDKYNAFDMYHRKTTTYTMGCLCVFNPDWHRLDSWQHGHAVAEAQKSGLPLVEVFEIEGGEVRRS